MKNLLKTFGIITIIAVIGFSMTACDDGNGGGGGGGGGGPDPADLIGFWQHTSENAKRIEFTATEIKVTSNPSAGWPGHWVNTVTYTSDTITMTGAKTGTVEWSITGTTLTLSDATGDFNSNFFPSLGGSANGTYTKYTP